MSALADTAPRSFATSQAEAQQLEQELLRASPIALFEYVDVSFGTANTDLDIRHNLRPPSPEEIDYQIVRANQAVVVYHDQSGTRRPWGQGYLVLRANTANARVTLLLTVRRLL